LSSLILTEQNIAVVRGARGARGARVLAAGILELGIDQLPWSKAALQFRARVQFLRQAEGEEWPDLSDDGLARSAAEWLEPILADKIAVNELGADELSAAVMNLLPW